MNKKLLFLMVGMIVCLTIIGGALAAAYFNADPLDTTVSTDEYLKLEIGTGATGLLLESGRSQITPIELTYDKVGDEQNPTCTATFTLAGNLEGVSVGLYTTESCESLVAGTVVQEGEGTITVTGISSTTTYYLKVSFDATGMEADEINAVTGSITVHFVKDGGAL